jgi:predicted lipoprotein with Yx(FWY)xxD motif
MRLSRIRIAAIAAMFALTLAACSNGEDDGDAESPAASPEETAEATVGAEDSDLGEIVVDAEGRTLYVFLADESTESTCYDECEEAWPPLTVDGEPVAGEGVDASLLATSERSDGSTQVTLDGHPLYYFGADETPDDMNGQGVGDVWYVVSPSGDAIEG